jgi:hypothetical protein
MKNDIYSFGVCANCSEHTALKNGYCVKCDELDLPDFFKDIFRRKEEQHP